MQYQGDYFAGDNTDWKGNVVIEKLNGQETVELLHRVGLTVLGKFQCSQKYIFNWMSIYSLYLG
jgi:hypothetical protein